MFRWKKRDEGFEWHTYVRTTIKLRREARRDRAQRLGVQVAGGARAAGAAAGSVAKSGARTLGVLTREFAAHAGRVSVSCMAMAGAGLGSGLRALGRGLAPAVDVLGRPGVAGPMTFAGLIAAAAGILRLYLAGGGIDAEAVAALAIGAGCIAMGLGPSVWLGHAAVPVRIGAPVTDLPSRPWLVAGGVALAALLGGIAYTVLPWRTNLSAVASLPGLPFRSSAPLTGRASVIGPDVLKVANRRVRLAGLEPLDMEQRCPRPGTKAGGRTWACGQEAREATQRLVQGQTVSCEVGAADVEGLASGRCQVAGADVGEALVRAGHAFAQRGLMSPYKSAEETARSARAGLWASQEPERPAAWRDRLWAAAKRQSPDGCPIKGRVRGDERVYLLPWSSDYERVRLSKRRGERWFCSEQEALAAGWRSARRG